MEKKHRNLNAGAALAAAFMDEERSWIRQKIAGDESFDGINKLSAEV